MKVLDITMENFEKEVLDSDMPVLVDFYATWCGPCSMMAPVIESLADDADDFKVGRVDVDNESDLAATYGVESIPCIVLFKNGAEADRSVGAVPRERLEDMLQS